MKIVNFSSPAGVTFPEKLCVESTRFSLLSRAIFLGREAAASAIGGPAAGALATGSPAAGVLGTDIPPVSPFATGGLATGALAAGGLTACVLVTDGPAAGVPVMGESMAGGSPADVSACTPSSAFLFNSSCADVGTDAAPDTGDCSVTGA